MTKIHNYTVRTWAETAAGEPGYSYEIRDAERRWCGGGWSRGKKKDALDDARTQIAKLQALKPGDATISDADVRLLP